MGSELVAIIKVGRKKFTAKVLLESNSLIIRGVERKVIPFEQMHSLLLKSAILKFSFKKKTYHIHLGDTAAAWFNKIKNPKSVLDKIGFTSDSKTALFNISDTNFTRAVKRKTDGVSIDTSVKNSDIIIVEANNRLELEKIFGLKKHLRMNGALWIVFTKGKSAAIKDTEVMETGKRFGLVDVKVVGFSETHTALKFVIPVKDRK